MSVTNWAPGSRPPPPLSAQAEALLFAPNNRLAWSSSLPDLGFTLTKSGCFRFPFLGPYSWTPADPAGPLPLWPMSGAIVPGQRQLGSWDGATRKASREQNCPARPSQPRVTARIKDRSLRFWAVGWFIMWRWLLTTTAFSVCHLEIHPSADLKFRTISSPKFLPG